MHPRVSAAFRYHLRNFSRHHDVDLVAGVANAVNFAVWGVYGRLHCPGKHDGDAFSQCEVGGLEQGEEGLNGRGDNDL